MDSVVKTNTNNPELSTIITWLFNRLCILTQELNIIKAQGTAEDNSPTTSRCNDGDPATGQCQEIYHRRRYAYYEKLLNAFSLLEDPKQMVPTTHKRDKLLK